MQNSKPRLGKYLLIILTIILIPLISCDEEDPVSPTEEHFEAEGVVLRTSGIKIAEIYRGETADTLSATVSEVGDHITVSFYDSDKNEINAPNEENDKLAWEIGDETILKVGQHEGEEGGFEFHLEGLKEGISSIELFIVHHEHNDFRSGKIPVKVGK
ncbi:MAG: hypothetical protein GY936_11490 [Ignavibacteriae bacterium]|nr:hypothetical protein [Ignavibacteriota bacterium]